MLIFCGSSSNGDVSLKEVVNELLRDRVLIISYSYMYLLHARNFCIGIL